MHLNGGEYANVKFARYYKLILKIIVNNTTQYKPISNTTRNEKIVKNRVFQRNIKIDNKEI